MQSRGKIVPQSRWTRESQVFHPVRRFLQIHWEGKKHYKKMLLSKHNLFRKEYFNKAKTRYKKTIRSPKRDNIAEKSAEFFERKNL